MDSLLKTAYEPMQFQKFNGFDSAYQSGMAGFIVQIGQKQSEVALNIIHNLIEFEFCRPLWDFNPVNRREISSVDSINSQQYIAVALNTNGMRMIHWRYILEEQGNVPERWRRRIPQADYLSAIILKFDTQQVLEHEHVPAKHRGIDDSTENLSEFISYVKGKIIYFLAQLRYISMERVFLLSFQFFVTMLIWNVLIVIIKLIRICPREYYENATHI